GLDVDDAAVLDVEVRTAIERLVDDRLLVRASAGGRVLVQMAPDATLPLDAFKNQLLHHVVPECIVATAFAACTTDNERQVPRTQLKEAARTISRILKIEFIFRAGATFDELFDEATKNGVAVGFVEDADDALRTP